jgi:hypothetical protein
MKYIIGGVVLETEIVFPELLEHHTEQKVDFTVAYAKVPEQLTQVKENRILVQTSFNGEVLFSVPGIAKFHVRADKKISIELLDTGRKSDAEKYILTFIFGVISYLKGFFPLHGGGIIHDGKAILFSGDCGIGKSTTIAGLNKRGFLSIGDDISNLFMHNGKVFMHPCFPRFKLWEDSLELIGESKEEGYPLLSKTNKLLVPVKSAFTSLPIEVKQIYHLQKNRAAEYQFSPYQGFDKIKFLQKNAYREWLISGLGLQANLFSLINNISNHTNITSFNRPMIKGEFDYMLDLLISDFDKS